MKTFRKCVVVVAALALLMTATGCIAPLLADVFFVVGPFLL